MNNKEESLKETLIKETYNHFKGIKEMDDIRWIAEVVFQKIEDKICEESEEKHDSELLDALVEGKHYDKCNCKDSD